MSESTERAIVAADEDRPHHPTLGALELTAEEIAALEEPYVPHRVVGAQ